MKRIIVPTDFSDTAKNAARFAVQMARDIGDTSVVLYNAYDSISSGSDGTTIFSDTDARKKISEVALSALESELEALSGIKVAILAEEGSLTDNLEKIVHHQNIDLIVMGINGATRLDQVLIGSSTLSVINQNFCPVMIIPPDAKYRAINTVVFASDFKDVESTTPVKSLRTILDMFKPTLKVVNVDADHYVELTEEYKSERVKLESILDGYNPDFAFIRMYDFVESINMYAEDQNADLIITVPRRHSFLEGLFKTSHTKKLAYHTHIPILALHE